MFHHNIPYPIKIIDYDIMIWKQPIKLIITPILNQRRSHINTETQHFWGDFSIWQCTGNTLRQSLEKGLRKIKETVAELWCLP